MRIIILAVLTNIVSGVSAAQPLIDISKLTQRAISEVTVKYESTKDARLSLIDVEVHKKSHNLNQIYLQLTIANIDSHHKGDISENAYDTYMVRFSFEDGDYAEIVESGLETYKLIEDEVLQ